MKSALDQLTTGERKALAHFYESPAHTALKKLLEIERLELAKDHVEEKDILQIRYLSGQVASLKRLLVTLRSNFKESNKDKKS